MTRRAHPLLPILAVFAAACSSPEDHKYRLPLDRFQVKAGTQVMANFNTEAQVDGPGPGSQLGLEDDLGLDDDVATGRIDADLRLGRNHHILASYYRINRSANATINTEFMFEDVIFEAGANVSASLDMDIFKAAYRYDVWRDRRTEVGLSLGAHTMLVDLEVAGSAMIVGGGGGSVHAERSLDVPLPLPVIGVHGRWIMADKWILSSDTQVFGLEVEDFDGHLIDSYVTLEWRFSKHVGVGIGYNRFIIDLGLDDDDWKGDFEYTYNGLQVFLSGSL